MLETISVPTSRQTELLDLTSRVQEVLRRLEAREGICYVYVPHTTAGVTINEHADPSVAADLLMVLNKLITDREPYRHLEGNSPAHIKATLVGASVAVPVMAGRLALGTWQGIFFCEFDGPRQRKVQIKFLSG